MPARTWTPQIGGVSHTVRLEHGYWSNKRIVRVDGEHVRTERRTEELIFPLGSENRFAIGGVECAVIVTRTNLFFFRYDLAVDGRSVATGQPLALHGLPGWTWVFVAGCLLIAVLGFLQRHVNMLAVLGAALCAFAAYDVRKPVVLRVLFCAAVLLFAWTGFVQDFL